MGIDPFSLIMFAASTAYQMSQQKKMKKKQAAAAEARKGFELTTSGEASPIPVVYGKNFIGGNAVKHHITSSYTSGPLNSAAHFVENFENSTTTLGGGFLDQIITKLGGKNEYLHVQYALCHDGIEGVQFVKVNDLDYNDAEQKFSHTIRTFGDGGTADAIATANGIASTNTFTGTAYASATFKLDRDDPQYNGAPEMGFLLKGRKVRAVELNTGVYSLAASYVYSNNPALCLLDYMLNADFGRGLTVAEVDLQSFYDAAVVCGTTVSSGRAISGRINGTSLTGSIDPTASVNVVGVDTLFTTELVVGDQILVSGETRTVATITDDLNLTVTVAFTDTDIDSSPQLVLTRDIPLYECNITLDTDAAIRDNIQSIMSTMAMAELTWSSEGKYKLMVEYPTTAIETDALVDASHYFTDDDIVRDDVNLSWPSASDRFNQATVSFLNEHEDFKSDSMTWPKTNSTAHTTYLTEDNQQPFVGSTTLEGVTDPYHALAAAEQIVRQSRSMVSLSMTVTKKGLSLEPGDFINVTSTTSNISNEVYRVESIEVMSDFAVRLSCYFFDHEALAWNVNDDIAYSVRPTFDFTVEPVTSLVYTAGRPFGDHTALAELTWTAPTDGSFKSVVYYTDDAGDLVILGETSSSEFYVYPRDDWTNGESVTFTVKAQTPLGRLSTGVSVNNTVVKTPPAPTSFSAAETLYQTNKASGVKARATLSFSEPVGGVEPKDYRVEYYRDEDGGPYKLLGYTVGQTYVFNDIRAGNYHFRITPISWFDHEGTPLIGTKEILGLSAIPADPTGFVSKVTETGVLLTWNTPSDLDVVSGGTTEIRFVRDDVVTPKWEIAQTIVNNISGSTTTAALPISPGYYLIKHFDSSGNACANAAQLLNTFVGPDFNAITTITEDPTFAGAKTNGTVVNGNLVKNSGASTMTYLFNNSIDLGSVENIRLVPRLAAFITDGVTVVADYDPVSNVSRFAGPIVDASITFEVRYSNDDPSGSPTWSDWETFTIGSYRHRAFEFRLTAVVASQLYTVEVSELSLTADKADVTHRGYSTSSGTGQVSVTFPTPFYGGIGGADIPYVGLATIGTNTGISSHIISVSPTGFVYKVTGGGGGSHTVNWVAVGQ